MKVKSIIVVVGLAIVSAAAVFAITGKYPAGLTDEKDQEAKEETIEGVVVVADTNEAGEVLEIAIQDTIESKNEQGVPETIIEEYRVKKDDKSMELLNLIGKKVQVIGMIKAETDGSKTITVKSFTLIEPKPDKTDKTQREYDSA